MMPGGSGFNIEKSGPAANLHVRLRRWAALCETAWRTGRGKERLENEKPGGGGGPPPARDDGQTQRIHIGLVSLIAMHQN